MKTEFKDITEFYQELSKYLCKDNCTASDLAHTTNVNNWYMFGLLNGASCITSKDCNLYFSIPDNYSDIIILIDNLPYRLIHLKNTFFEKRICIEKI